MNKQQLENIYNSIKAALDNFGSGKDGRSLENDVQQEVTRVLNIIEMVDSLLKKRGNERLELLEVGIGWSYVTSALRSVFPSDLLKISAVEHPHVPLLSREDFKNHLIRTEVSLTHANICEEPLPYADSTFDVVVFSETIEHLPPTIVPAVLKEISRLLKSNGVAIISTPNLAAWQYRWKLMRGKKIFDPALPLEWAGGTYAHIRLYTPEEIESLLAHFGLKVIAVKYANFGINNKRFYKKAFLKLFNALFPSLAPEFFIFAEKS